MKRNIFRRSKPAPGLEPGTARLRIGCSTTELSWRKLNDDSDPKPCPKHASSETTSAPDFVTVAASQLTPSPARELNRRPPDYESGALPLSYCGKFWIFRIPALRARRVPIHQLALMRTGCGNALERTRTAMPFGTTPSRWRVYQFHHQGYYNQKARSSKTAASCKLS